MNIQIVKKAEKLFVKSPYNEKFIAGARILKGKWDPVERAWIFAEEQEESVRELVFQAYGWEENGEVVYVAYKASDLVWEGQITIGGLLVACRKSRDWNVTLVNTCVTEGEFPPSGGSAKYPVLGSMEKLEKIELMTCLSKRFFDEKVSDEEKSKMTILEKPRF